MSRFRLWALLMSVALPMVAGPCSRAQAAAPPGTSDQITVTITGTEAHDGDYLYEWNEDNGWWQYAAIDENNDGVSGYITPEGDGNIHDYANGGEDVGAAGWSGVWDAEAYSMDDFSGEGTWSGGSGAASVPESSNALGVAATAFFPLALTRRSRHLRRDFCRLCSPGWSCGSHGYWWWCFGGTSGRSSLSTNGGSGMAGQ